MRVSLNRNVIVCAIASVVLLVALSFELYAFARVQNVWINENPRSFRQSGWNRGKSCDGFRA